MPKCKRMIQCVLWMVMMCGVSSRAPDATKAPEASGVTHRLTELAKAAKSGVCNLGAIAMNSVTYKTNRCYINITKAYIKCITGNEDVESNKIGPEIITKAIEYFNKDCQTKYGEGSAEGEKIIEHVTQFCNYLLKRLNIALNYLNSFTGVGQGAEEGVTLDLEYDMKMRQFISVTGIIKDEYCKKDKETELNSEAMNKITDILLENWYSAFETNFKEKIKKSIETHIGGGDKKEVRIYNSTFSGSYIIHKYQWREPICTLIHGRALHSRMLFLQEYMNDMSGSVVIRERQFWQKVQENSMTIKLYTMMQDIIEKFESFNDKKGYYSLTPLQNNLSEALRSAIEIYPKIIEYCLDHALSKEEIQTLENEINAKLADHYIVQITAKLSLDNSQDLTAEQSQALKLWIISKQRELIPLKHDSDEHKAKLQDFTNFPPNITDSVQNHLKVLFKKFTSTIAEPHFTQTAGVDMNKINQYIRALKANYAINDMKQYAKCLCDYAALQMKRNQKSLSEDDKKRMTMDIQTCNALIKDLANFLAKKPTSSAPTETTK